MDAVRPELTGTASTTTACFRPTAVIASAKVSGGTEPGAASHAFAIAVIQGGPVRSENCRTPCPGLGLS